MNFKLNIGTLTTTINEYYKLMNILSEQMENINNALTELTEAGWSGEARDKFIELHQKKQALFAELQEELEYMKNALENEEKPKAVQLKMRSEDFVNCIKRTGNGGALTSNDEGVIILEGNQFSINNNINNCTSSCYPPMQSRFQEIMQLVNGLEYTSFGISGDVWNGETSIRNQTTSLTEFQDSFNIYCNDVQNMESNICSVLSKISGIGDITKFESSSVISESGEIDKNKVKELMLKNQDDLTDEEKELLDYIKKLFSGEGYNEIKENQLTDLLINETLTDEQKEVLEYIKNVLGEDNYNKLLKDCTGISEKIFGFQKDIYGIMAYWKKCMEAGRRPEDPIGTGNFFIDFIFDVAGFTIDTNQGIYVSNENPPIQKVLGYNHLYDEAATIMLCDIDCEPICFDYEENGVKKHWMIELWKGQYGISTGCEVGVYTQEDGEWQINGQTLHYDCAGEDDQLKISYDLYKKGESNPLFHRESDSHWWLTGFDPGVNSIPEDLTMNVNITLKDPKMEQAFLKSLGDKGYKLKDDMNGAADVKIDGNTVSFNYGTPKTDQAWTRGGAMEDVSIIGTKVVTNWYNEAKNGVEEISTIGNESSIDINNITNDIKEGNPNVGDEISGDVYNISKDTINSALKSGKEIITDDYNIAKDAIQAAPKVGSEIATYAYNTTEEAVEKIGEKVSDYFK